MNKFAPKVGDVIYPFTCRCFIYICGSISRDSENAAQLFGAGHWLTKATLTSAEADKLLEGRVLNAEEGIVVYADDDRLEAVGKHHGTNHVIVFNLRNQLFNARELKLRWRDGRDEPDGWDLWAWPKMQDALEVSENCADIMRREGATVEVMPPSPVPPRLGPRSNIEGYMPQARLITGDGTHEGRITFGKNGEPIGIMQDGQHLTVRALYADN